MNEKYVAKFDEGVRAGLDGRPMTVTYIRDITDEQWNELAIKSLNIKLQAKQRAKVPSPLFSYETVNNGEVTVSSLLARTVTTAAPLTRETAKPVLKAQLSTMKPVEKVFYLIECNLLNLNGAQAMLDHMLEKEELTEDEHMAACDRLTEMDE